MENYIIQEQKLKLMLNYDEKIKLESFQMCDVDWSYIKGRTNVTDFLHLPLSKGYFQFTRFSGDPSVP